MNVSDPIALGLPHRAPFMFIDAVLSLQLGEKAVSQKTFTADEPFFRGHFPGDPLVPGVILAEALAQTAGLAAGQAGKQFRLTAIRSLKFFQGVRPEQELQLTARKLAVSGTLWQFEVVACVAEQVVAEGVIVLSES